MAGVDDPVLVGAGVLDHHDGAVQDGLHELVALMIKHPIKNVAGKNKKCREGRGQDRTGQAKTATAVLSGDKTRSNS